MQKIQHGPMVVDIAGADPSIAVRIWEKLGTINDRPWTLPRNRKLLVEAIGEKDAAAVYDQKDSHEQNRRMREIIAPHLKNSFSETKIKIANWIIYEWGGITRGELSSTSWTTELGSFSEKVNWPPFRPDT